MAEAAKEKLNEFIDLFDSSEKLDLEPAKLIEVLLSLEPSGQIYLDCSGAKTRSGISNWLGVRIIEELRRSRWRCLENQPH